MSDSLYPLITGRKIVEPIWGGRRLAVWLDLPPPRSVRLGEMWQAYDVNPVINGPLAGCSLADLARAYGPDLVGQRSFARYGAEFPLLAKFIDAADRLSIQVHPDDVYAYAHEADTGFHGKTEAWYILDAAPDADVIYGLTATVDRATFAAAAHDGSLDDLLQRIPVTPGDVIFVPAGTVHAINAGIMLFEIQQKSDLTYRVYDYNRRDVKTGRLRELHLEKALDVSDFGPARYGKAPTLNLSPGRDVLVACPYFALERLTLDSEYCMHTDPASLEIITLIDGVGHLEWREGTVPLRRGESIILPASLGAWSLVPRDAPITALRVYIPDMQALAVELSIHGYTADQIAATLRP
ncbi:MAG: type I phosphomannose isomerase catalytic subunit [Chloroflexales bacterium]